SQLPAERLLGDCDAEFLEDPLRQIDQPPAHHAMHRRDRTTLDHAGDGLPLSVVELGRLSCRLAIQETVRTAGVEAQHPVPDDLKSDTADLGRLGARCPIVDRPITAQCLLADISAPRFAERDLWNVTPRPAGQSALMPVNFTTLPHFSVSSAMNFPNSAEVINVGLKPMSRRRTFT